jgi:hypothetical protein
MPQTIERWLDEVGFVGSKEKFGGGRHTDEFWLTFTDFSDGWKSSLSGVRPKGKNGIEFDFSFQGKRYRPTIARVPDEANLRRAHKQLLADSSRLQPSPTPASHRRESALEH